MNEADLYNLYNYARGSSISMEEVNRALHQIMVKHLYFDHNLKVTEIAKSMKLKQKVVKEMLDM